MKKEAKLIDIGWSSLTIKYREWADMLARGRMRMKKKINKDGKEYYDFDFSRYQYYYSFPEDHISLAPPATQKQFINFVLEKGCEDFSSLYIDSQPDNWQQMEQILLPYEFHSLLADMRRQIDEKLAMLRIQKTLRIKKMKGTFGRENEIEKSLIELIEAEIRSYIHKKIRIQDENCLLGAPLESRLESHRSYLKTRTIDEFQFANVSKTDLIVYQRMRQSKQTLVFNKLILMKMVHALLKRQRSKIESQVKIAKASKIYKKRSQINEWKMRTTENLRMMITERDSFHFQSNQNKTKLEEVVESLDYISCMQKNIQLNTRRKISPPNYDSIELNYDQTAYIPKSTNEIRERLADKCLFYFSESILNEEIMDKSNEHICYKLNSLCYLQLKVLWETYNPAIKMQEKAVFKIRAMMRKQMELVFSKNLSKLLNIREHSMKIITSQKWYDGFLFHYDPKNEKEAIMTYEINVAERFKDPGVICLLSLISVNVEKVVREQIQNLVSKTIKSRENVYYHQSLFYKNCYSDEKTHLINVLNHSVTISEQDSDPVKRLYYDLMLSGPGKNAIDSNLLNSYYMLVYLLSVQSKFQLLELLNAQLMCMIKVQNRVRLLWKKSKIPFEMSKQFMTRFTESVDPGLGAFDFVNAELSEAHLEQIFKEMYYEAADRDRIVWKQAGGVEVKRRKSDNPLLEGKSIIYSMSLQLLQQALNRIEFLSSESIKRREAFLLDGKFTGIVDKLQLIYELLQSERLWQQAKLKVLQKLCETLLASISPSGIKNIYTEMHNIFLYNNIVDLTEPHFKDCYLHETSAMNSKAKVLNILIKKQKKAELNLIEKYESQMRMFNLSNSIPEISSMYYTEQVTIQEHSIIAEEENDDESEVQSSSADLRHTTNLSDVSSMLEAGSQYHLKTSFQQILAKNSVNAIKSENNKKQELLNRKRQKLINESFLGILIPRKNEAGYFKEEDQLFSSSHCCIEVIQHLDWLMKKDGLSMQQYAAFLQDVLEAVSNWQFDEFKPILKPDGLSIVLNSQFKILNKFIEKTKIQGNISARSAHDHWISLPSKVMEGIISGQSCQEIDELRGLYLIINDIHLNEINLILSLNQRFEASPYGYAKTFKQLINNYCNSLLFSELSFLKGMNVMENRSKSSFKLYDQLKEKGQVSQICCGNYYHYFRAISAMDLACQNFVSAANKLLFQEINELSQIKCELSIMQKFQCCSSLCEKIAPIPNMSNRVAIRKKLQFINSYQVSHIRKETILQIEQAYNQCFSKISSFSLEEPKMSINSFVRKSQEFEKYISEIIVSGIAVNMISSEIKASINTKLEIKKIKKWMEILPAVSKHLLVFPESNRTLKNVFPQSQENFSESAEKGAGQAKLVLKAEKMKFVDQVRNFFEDHSTEIKDWIQSSIWNRKKNELTSNIHTIKFEKYLLRSTEITAASLPESINLLDLLRTMTKIKQKETNVIKLRQWIEIQMLIFGSGLKQYELIKFRKMLCNPAVIFPVFWEDNTKHIISNRDLSKMKNSRIDAQEMINKYKKQYHTYVYLKKTYHAFVEDLSDYQLDQQSQDSLIVAYAGADKYFQRKTNDNSDWQYLFNFCTTESKPSNAVDQLCKFISSSNPNRRSSDASNNSFYDFDLLKHYCWNSQSRNAISSLDSTKRFLKIRLNDLKTRVSKPILNEIALIFYKKQRLAETISYLNINTSASLIVFEDMKEHFQKMVHDGSVILNSSQKYIFNLMQKDTESKAEFVKLKDEIMKVVVTNQYYQKLVREKFYEMSLNILDSQLALRQMLIEAKFNQDTARDPKILKQTINKILVPKVKLNPFLSSPLKIENYFFAGTIKLSYIDQFLNKLRNRAVLIELAEGGTGYLLKVNQLDESVESLCKAIVGFSEKQFADRFRTFMESFEDLKEKNQFLKQQNKNLKGILNIIKDFEAKEIKSLVYEKMNDYLHVFYEHDKVYSVTMTILKTLQNKIQKEVNDKFEEKIKELEKQNHFYRQNFKHFQAELIQGTVSHIRETKDTLFAKFKNEAQDILKKEFIPLEQGNSQCFQKIQAYDSEILLNKLKMQKIFSELKISKIENHLKGKITQLQKQLLEQNKLQNLLIMQQEKSRILAQQLKNLHHCSVENQILKKEMSKKQEEETIQKFRLVKVNESLKGKIKRMEVEIQEDQINWQQKINNITKTEAKSRSNFSVQVSNEFRTKTRKNSIHVKTQSNEAHRSLDSQIWRQKWLHTEKKSQLLVSALKKAAQHYVFTKNGARLVGNIKSMIEEFENHRVNVKPRQ